MDLMKVFDQTVREIKREVNKKVLKVPEIETKVLEATSNEPWGPHGTLMGEIADATRNYQDYQMIMDILWRRTADIGKNWRHVYKALTLFEFLLANANERVISDLRERSYQISTLVDFQFVEPNGKDQGINVRKKAEIILSLINDKEKIKEVRQKAQANRNKYRGISSTGGLYNKPSSYSSTGGAYGNDQLDEDRYGSTGRYGRDKDEEDQYGREDLNKDDYEEDRYNSRNGEHRDRLYDDDDDHNSSRRSESKDAGSRMSAPPKYEDVSTEEKSYSVLNLLDEGQDVLPTTGTQNGFSKFAGADEPDDFDFDPRASSATTSKSTEQSSTLKAFPAPSCSVGDNILFGDTDFNPNFSSAVPLPMQSADDDLFGDSVEFKSAVPAPFDPFNNSENFSTFPGTVGKTSSTVSFNPTGSVPTTQVGGGGPNFPSGVDLFGDFEGSVPTTQKGGGVGGSNISTGVDLFGGSTGSVPTAQADPFGDMSFGEFSSSSTVTSLDSQTSSVKQSQLKKDKFEPKSKVWADELSKGLIDLNIGGPKSNSLAELGISLDTYTTNLHFEKKKEEKISTIPAGKAMGSGSGLGIAGATLLTPPSLIRPPMGNGSSYMGIGMPPPMGSMGSMGLGSRKAEPSMNQISGEYPNQHHSYGGYR